MLNSRLGRVKGLDPVKFVVLPLQCSRIHSSRIEFHHITVLLYISKGGDTESGSRFSFLYRIRSRLIRIRIQFCPRDWIRIQSIPDQIWHPASRESCRSSIGTFWKMPTWYYYTCLGAGRPVRQGLQIYLDNLKESSQKEWIKGGCPKMYRIQRIH